MSKFVFFSAFVFFFKMFTHPSNSYDVDQGALFGRPNHEIGSGTHTFAPEFRNPHRLGVGFPIVGWIVMVRFVATANETRGIVSKL